MLRWNRKLCANTIRSPYRALIISPWRSSHAQLDISNKLIFAVLGQRRTINLQSPLHYETSVERAIRRAFVAKHCTCCYGLNEMNKCVAKQIETNFKCVYIERASEWRRSQANKVSPPQDDQFDSHIHSTPAELLRRPMNSRFELAQT